MPLDGAHPPVAAVEHGRLDEAVRREGDRQEAVRHTADRLMVAAVDPRVLGEALAEGKSEDELKEEYRAIAERRVRLGLILSDVGQKNELKVEQHELNAAIMDQARRYPGQEQKVLEFFRKNPAAVEQLRAPLYEDKVVDFILQMANVSERQVTPEELMADPDAEEEASASGGAPDPSAA